MHPAAVALQLIGLQAVIFVKVEGHDARKIEPILAMEANQFAIDSQRRRARRQAQDGHLTKGIALADDAGNGVGHVPS